MQPQAVLLSAFSSLAVPFGFERSCKLSAGALNQDRFLLTQHKNCFGQEPLAALLKLASALEMPEEGLNWLRKQFQKAELIHAGYEGDNGAPLCKLYVEYPYSEIDDDKGSDGFLLHQAIKWYPEDGRHLITDYRCLPYLSQKQFISFVRECLGSSGQVQATWVENLLLQSCNSELPMMLDVSEPKTVRRSFDLNLYDFALRIGDLAPLLKGLFQSFSISSESTNQFIEQNADQMLGHVSGGVNREGEPFITLYFGVEERCG